MSGKEADGWPPGGTCKGTCLAGEVRIAHMCIKLLAAVQVQVAELAVRVRAR